MRLLEILVSVIKFIPLWLYLIITRPFHVYTYYFNRQSYYKACSSGFKFFLSILGIKLSIYGTELLPKSGKKYLIASNHQSFMDVFIMESLLPCAFIQRPVSYIPGFSWHFGKLSIIIDREHPLSILRTIRYVKEVAMKEGVPIAMFPEATRSEDGKLGVLRLGAATITKTLNLPVLPVVIYNSRDIMPRGVTNPRPGTVLVGIQPLIEEEFIRSHTAEEINQEIKQRLQNGLDNLAQKRQETA